MCALVETVDSSCSCRGSYPKVLVAVNKRGAQQQIHSMCFAFFQTKATFNPATRGENFGGMLMLILILIQVPNGTLYLLNSTWESEKEITSPGRPKIHELVIEYRKKININIPSGVK